MDIGIVGGGASGMILASKLKNNKVTILEKNSKLGKKLLLTGNGKCNFTNKDFNDLNSIYNNDLAKNVFKRYDNYSLINYFESLGIVSKTETHRGVNYIYPNSNKSTSVVYNLLDKIYSNSVNIKYNSCVKKVIKNNNKFELILKSDDVMYFDKLVMACGGNSYQNTGSDGLGYSIAKSLGHNIINVFPALCALKYSDSDLKKIKGVRVDAKIFVDFNNIKFEEVGEIQFTDFGISGVPVFNLSRLISRYINSGNSLDVNLDFFYTDKFSNLTDHKEKLYNYLIDRQRDISYKRIKDFLCGFLPDEISEIVLNRSNIKSKSIDMLTNDELNSIVENIINFKICLIGTASFDNAQITIGGVDTNDINHNSLESKIVDNLYFIGEMIDIEGKCGGYNLQLAYSTASIVADSLGG